MQKTISSTKARTVFSTILDEIQLNNDLYVINRKGKPVAAIVPLAVLDSWEKSRNRLIELIDIVSERNRDISLSEDEVMDMVLEAQQAVKVEVNEEA